MTDRDPREARRHRRRTPREERPADESSITKWVRDACDLVPEAGNGYRWYDYPYRALRWFLRGWRRKVVPYPARRWAVQAAHRLAIHNQHDLDKVWPLADPHHNVLVDTDEHVNVAGAWLVELFPPAELAALETAIRRNGWGRLPVHAQPTRQNSEALRLARSGGGLGWWRLAELVSRDSRRPVPDGVRTDMPEQFDLVELRAVQVGASLTAVVARFHLTDDASTALDAEWHKPHEPMVLRGHGRPRALDRKWATYWQVQSERKRLHDAARQWFARRLPGFFAHSSTPQPLLDLMLFDGLDPTVVIAGGQDHKRQVLDALRALGLHVSVYQVSSPDLPRLVLEQVDGTMHEALGHAPTWTLWGSRPAVLDALGDGALEGYGSDPNRAIAARLVDQTFDLLVLLAVSEYLKVTKGRYAAVRDRASARHVRFRPRAVDDLRRTFLELSIDLLSVRRDVTMFWDRGVRWWGEPQFTIHLSPGAAARDREHGREPQEPRSFNDHVRDTHARLFEELEQADRDYRDVLSTVASLGASSDTYRVGRVALLVSIASLLVAAVALLGTEAGAGTPLGHIWAWLAERLGWAATTTSG